MPFQVHQDGAVPVALAPREVINPDDKRGRRRSSFGPAEQAEERVSAGRHRQLLCQPSAGLAAQRQTDLAVEIAQPCGAARPRSGCYLRQAFSENPSRAGRHLAPETPRGDPNGNCSSLPRQIGQGAGVAAVHTRRRSATQRATRRTRFGSGQDKDTIQTGLNLLDQKTGGQERKDAFGQSRNTT
nr:hypothetical protein [Azospirillum sp. TSA2s]